ncbi:PREDICTED: transmembrane protein 241, partial [Buceros rhinoceros silvestris]|uniref:transmembrane protein 241 n=1 Tax=Buceros rhinoceros silvestris TaxID=175836 RepID=UPI00052865DF
YVLSVLKFTYPTLFQGWQTLVGGLLLHVSWKLGWVEINLCSRSDIVSWLPASVLFVGIIYAGSRALSRLPIPVFLTVHSAAEVITCGFQKFVEKEQTSHLKVCSVLFLLVAAVCLPLCDTQFDPNGYLWALIHLICVGAYKVFHKFWKPSSLSDLDQQYINYVFSVVLLASASHPAGDLFSALDFPFLYFYRFHSSCCASGLLGFFLMLHSVKLKSSTTSGQYAAWIFLAKVWEERRRVDMHERNTWLNLSSSPETNMSHLAWAFEPTLMPSEPRHSQPWTLMAFQSDSAGSDGYSTLTFPRRLALQTSYVNVIGSSSRHLSADFE